MAVDIAGAVGPENMKPEAKEIVIRTLAALPMLPSSRRYLYSRWARVVGVTVRKEDIDRVAASM